MSATRTDEREGGDGGREAANGVSRKASEGELKRFRGVVTLVDLLASAYLLAFWYVVLGSTSELLLPGASRIEATILAWFVFVIPVLASAVLAWLRPGRVGFVAAATLPIIALVPILLGQARADSYLALAIAQALLAAAVITPLVFLVGHRSSFPE